MELLKRNEEVLKFAKEHPKASIRDISNHFNLGYFCIKNIFKRNNFSREKSLVYGEERTKKIKQTNLEKYGVENTFCLKGVKEKASKNFLEKYGIDNPSKVPTIKQKAEEKRLKTYYTKTEEERREITKKMWETKKENGSFKTSKWENEIYEYIKKDYSGKIERNVHILKNGEIDIYLPDLKIGIECNGTYWHSREGANHITVQHKNKTKEAEDLGIQLVHIYEWEWPSKKTEQYLTFITRSNEIRKIYARKCEIREVDFKTHQEFNNLYHLQGAQSPRRSPDWVCYGLYYENELVQLMSFDHPYRNKNYEWEIIRGCFGSIDRVIGGASKLFKYFIKEKDPSSIMSYCDADKFDGRGYIASGMKLEKWNNRIYYVLKDNKVTSYMPRQEKNRLKMMEKWTGLSVQSAGTKLFVWKKEN